MRQTTIKDLKFGDYFTLKKYDDTEKEVSERVVWMRGDYSREARRYSCYKYTDTNHESFFKGTRKVYTDIYF